MDVQPAVAMASTAQRSPTRNYALANSTRVTSFNMAALNAGGTKTND